MSNNVNKPAVASSTVTRDLRELDIKTDNIYESLVIMSKRANQISNNIKEELHQKLSEFLPPMITWKKFLKIASKSRFPSITKSCQNHRWWPSRNSWRIKFITAILRRSNKPFSNSKLKSQNSKSGNS